MVQWLRFHPATQRTVIPHALGQLYWNATTAEPSCDNRRVLELHWKVLHDAVKIPSANTKTRCSQEKKNNRAVTTVWSWEIGRDYKAPTQVEDGNLRLSPRFLVHHRYLTTSQSKESHPPWGLTPNFVCKTIPLTIEDFRLLGTGTHPRVLARL